MNLVKFLQSLFITVIIISSQFISQSKAQNRGDVYCEKKVKYPKSNDEYPSTMMKNTTGNFIPLIYWVGEVAGETPEERCEKVSEIIQARIHDKTWNKLYFRAGKSQQGYPVICFVEEDNQPCNDRNIIVKLNKKEDAARVLDKMFALRYRTDLKLTGEARFYCDEVSEDICYDIDEFLEAIADLNLGQ
ncbi:MAG: COP23 domain-containing protein [Crocosphaera sp.]